MVVFELEACNDISMHLGASVAVGWSQPRGLLLVKGIHTSSLDSSERGIPVQKLCLQWTAEEGEVSLVQVARIDWCLSYLSHTHD